MTIKTVGKLSGRQPATPSFETDGEERKSETQTKGGQGQTTFEKRAIKSPTLEIGDRKPSSIGDGEEHKVAVKPGPVMPARQPEEQRSQPHSPQPIRTDSGAKYRGQGHPYQSNYQNRQTGAVQRSSNPDSTP